MKNILTFAIALALGCTAASAQYFSPKQGQVMYYKVNTPDGKENKESMMKSTMVSVQTAADGIVSAKVEDVESDPSNPFAEVKTFKGYSYDPKTDITTVIVMTGDDFKEFVMTMIKESAEANRQHLSPSELSDLEKTISTKGELAFKLDPKAAADSKLDNSTLRLNAGQMTMNMNLWEGKFLGTESITVEAGTYDCLKVSYVLRISTPAGNEKKYITEWYAKDLGPVRFLQTDKKGKVVTEQSLRMIK